MESLSRASGETSTFAVWSGTNVIALARTNGSGAFQLTDRVGAVRPAHATATGRVLLAALPANRFEDYLGQAELVRFTPTTISDPDELRADVARVRRSGMALDNAQFHADVCCIAVPVLDFRGATIGAMGLSGPVERMTARARTRHAGLLLAAARELSAELGYAAPADGAPASSAATARDDSATALRPPRGTKAGAPSAPASKSGSESKPRRRTTRRTPS